MTTILNRGELRELIEYDKSPCISMFLPTNRGSREERQDAIRLKNLSNRALDALGQRGMRRPDAEAMLAPLADVLSETAPERHRGDSLACFTAPNFVRVFSIPLQLDELLVVNERLYVKPLLPLLHAGGRFYLLALSKDSARLFEATPSSLRELDLPNIPRAELDGPRETLQYHTHQAPSQGRGGTSEAMYHGQGGPDDRTKIDALNYFHRVDDAVRQVLPAGKTPLVLACVDYLAPIYRAANHYAELLERHVSGSPNVATFDALRAEAWGIVEPQFRQGLEKAMEGWHILQNKNLASGDIGEIVLAADAGRVDRLFVKTDARRWGRIEPQRRRVDLVDKEQFDAIELTDYAAARSLVHGGEVYAVDEVPAPDSPLAATFRY